MAPPPLPAAVAPVWTPIPGEAAVFYAPNLGVDVFRYGSSYYYFYHNAWFQGSSYRGPWVTIEKPPAVFMSIGPTYYRTAPPQVIVPAPSSGK